MSSFIPDSTARLVDTDIEMEFLAAPEHPDAVVLHEYWLSKRGGRPFPDRSDISPSDFSRLLPNILIAEVLDGGRDFRFRLAFTGNADGAFCTAARGEIRQGIERGDGIAEMIQQVAEGDGADIFAAGEAEAGKTLRGGERRCHAGQSPVLSSAFFWPMRDSSPARRRRMLSRCAM